jgi:hypothetical protein
MQADSKQQQNARDFRRNIQEATELEIRLIAPGKVHPGAMIRKYKTNFY